MSKVPSFEFATCARCDRPVERMTIVRDLDEDSYRVTVFCHEQRQTLGVSQHDIDQHGGNPLVKMSKAFEPL
jgi:hypothetical protein